MHVTVYQVPHGLTMFVIIFVKCLVLDNVVIHMSVPHKLTSNNAIITSYDRAVFI